VDSAPEPSAQWTHVDPSRMSNLRARANIPDARKSDVGLRRTPCARGLGPGSDPASAQGLLLLRSQKEARRHPAPGSRRLRHYFVPHLYRQTARLPCAADLWVQASLEQRQRFQQLFFPNGIAFDGNGFVRTAATALAFSCLRPIEAENEGLVAQTGIESLLTKGGSRGGFHAKCRQVPMNSRRYRPGRTSRKDGVPSPSDPSDRSRAAPRFYWSFLLGSLP